MNKKNEISIEEIQKLLPSALKKGGWTIPVTVDEVIATERRLANDPPTKPSDPPDFSEEGIRSFREKLERKKRKDKPGLYENETDREAEENLARAAREGSEIPVEIEERMDKDRQHTERENS